MNVEELKTLVERLVEIGCALSSERNIDALLEMIVDELRRFTRADGGTLFLVSPDKKHLDWAIVQNDSMGIRKGGAAAEELGDSFQPIPLFDDAGEPIHSNVATYAFHEQCVVNIRDVHDTDDDFDFEGPRRFDESTGYRTQSMLVVPLMHFEGGVVGILQLINATDMATGDVVEFGRSFEDLTRSLAGQAAVAVKNAELFEELEEQFESFIRSIAMTIDEKSAYTAGHVRRVVDLTLRFAHAINATDHGPYAEIRFTQDEIKALRVASWMHDIGKVTTPEWVVDKPTKLCTIFDRIDLVKERFTRFEREAEIRALEAKLLGGDGEQIDLQLQKEIEELRSDLAFLERINRGTEFMFDANMDRLDQIASKHDGALLNEDEIKNLSIRRGTLTPDEIAIIRDHARVSLEILSQLPFSRHLADVPEIAASHHEKLNGKGYPRGLSADDLGLQARILAVADIFEALSAADRPYKEPTPLSGVLRILRFMVKDGELDPDLVEFGLKSGVFDSYADSEVAALQRDLTFADAEL
jgi:HD-GYP domain-containing protein (c-di-GMP phosphodiesterase class II)